MISSLSRIGIYTLFKIRYSYLAMNQSFHNFVFDITIINRFNEEPVISRNPEIIYVMEGILVVIKEDTEWILHKNDYLVINSEEKHRYIIKESGLFALIRMKYTEVEDYLELRTHEVLCHSMLEGEGSQSKTGRILQSIIGFCLSQDTADEARMFAEFYNLLYQLREVCLIPKGKNRIGSMDDSDRRQELISQYIRENYNKKITLTDLSKATYMSASYLSRYIKEKFGKTFSEVLMDVRLEHAEKDIVQTSLPITHIALDNGFSLPAAFNKAFRQRYGMPPSAYRKNHFQSGDPEREPAYQVVQSEITLEQKIQDFISKQGQSYLSSGSNIAELSAHVREGKLFHRFWEELINIGTFRDLMRAEMQEQLIQLKEGLHFSHVRIWDLYSPELMLFRGDAQKRLNFSRLDGVLDFLHNHEIRPYIELGAKPVVLLKNVEEYLLYEERTPRFSTPEEYGAFLKQFIIHYVNRYGIEEIEKWYFEQWMDTRIENVDLYLDVFDAVYSNIKSVSPNIRIGGPGLSEETLVRLPELLKGWNGRVGKPDFISVYSYPYRAPSERAKQQEELGERSQESNYTKRMIEEQRKMLWDYGFWKQELHMNEWNFSLSNRNIINDSVFKGAYIVKTLLSIMEKVDAAGYWFGSDLFSEFYDSEHLLNGSGGLITKDRIFKPAYYGLYFFSRLDKYLLSYNEDGIIATNGRGNYTIVCHNYKHPNYQYYREKEGGITAQQYKDFFDEDVKQFHFVIHGVENGTYQIKTRIVDEENGSVLNEWEQMGYTDELTANDIDYLRRICVPRIQVEVMKIEEGVLEIHTQLKANAISFIHIYHLMQD